MPMGQRNITNPSHPSSVLLMQPHMAQAQGAANCLSQPLLMRLPHRHAMIKKRAGATALAHPPHPTRIHPPSALLMNANRPGAPPASSAASRSERAASLRARAASACLRRRLRSPPRLRLRRLGDGGVGRVARAGWRCEAGPGARCATLPHGLAMTKLSPHPRRSPPHSPVVVLAALATPSLPLPLPLPPRAAPSAQALLAAQQHHLQRRHAALACGRAGIMGERMVGMAAVGQLQR